MALLALPGCGDRLSEAAKEAPVAPSAVFEGLPLSGNLATALAAGFGNCLEDTKGIRCRKEGVTLLGVGPISAAVDLTGTPARFDHVTLWHPADQGLVLDVKPLLERSGWRSCLTPDAERLWHPPSPLRIAIDTNYWGSRRLVVSAPPPAAEPYC
ncbi:hypothetical protein [Sphingomonas sp. Root1294]|uniref:hypothetical protein n=1 Tax=Sphingomonas sp. Root1294 TaxID=1736447 RepID=UPI001F4043C4|nr:hypothetical protein [Sphingomonas sp. Root1294]